MKKSPMTPAEKERAKALRQHKKTVFNILVGRDGDLDIGDAETAEEWFLEEGSEMLADDDYRHMLLDELEWGILFGSGPRQRAKAIIEAAFLCLAPACPSCASEQVSAAA